MNLRRLRSPRKRPCVVLFPSNQPWDAASNLRAWLAEPFLQDLGWRTIVVPEPLTLRQRKRILASERPDVIFMQQTRHALNDPALFPEYPCVLDADDADFLDSRFADQIACRAAAAAAVVGGSRYVAEALGRFGPRHSVNWTGTPTRPSGKQRPNGQRRAVVAWAHASPLQYPREAEFIQKVLVEVGRSTSCEFWLFGTTQAEATAWFQPIIETGVHCKAIPTLPYEKYLDTVEQAAIGLQPIAPDNPFAQGKSFGKILAYLVGSVAVVASRSADHAEIFTDGVNGMLPEHSVRAWADRILLLLLDADTRARMANAGRDSYLRNLTTEVYARRLDAVLRDVAGAPSRSQ